MNYKGKELVEMTPENWDEKTREMLVWCVGDPAPSQLTVIGYDSMGWIDCESLTHWSHCAEIPEEKLMTTGNVEGLKRSLKYAHNALDLQNKQIEKLKAENDKLKEKIKSRDDRSKREDYESRAVKNGFIVKLPF